MMEVTTSAVFRPACLAASRTVPTGWPLGRTPIAPFSVLTPEARAVPAAAESVTRLLLEWVRMLPMVCWCQ
jgi:hypothetical protein